MLGRLVTAQDLHYVKPPAQWLAHGRPSGNGHYCFQWPRPDTPCRMCYEVSNERVPSRGHWGSTLLTAESLERPKSSSVCEDKEIECKQVPLGAVGTGAWEPQVPKTREAPVASLSPWGQSQP